MGGTTGIQKLSTKFSYEGFCARIKGLFHKDGLIFELSQKELRKLYEEWVFVDLYTYIPDSLLIKQFPSKMAKTCRAIPLCEKDGVLWVGMENPLHKDHIETIQSILGRSIFPVFIEKADLIRLFSQYYAHYEELKIIADTFDAQTDLHGSMSFLGDLQSPNKIAGFFQCILEDAEQVDASDIHVELFDQNLTIKFRVDGRLIDHNFPKPDVAFYLLRYMKILANADIAQENLPVEGKHVSVITAEGRAINLRLSIMPTGFGFSAVIRILPDNREFNLRTLLQDEGYYREVVSYLNLKQGMFIVSGPTGSGKSTTLYAAVAKVNTPDRKIVTLEDPIEIKMEGLCQVQINTDIGYDYSTSLRAILRQDPDVILVSEIRDSETAQAAMRAAITGHMVLSTIHTRSVKDIPLRFIDLGVDVFSLSSALKLLVSQRLVRILCPHCKELEMPDKDQRDLVRMKHQWIKESFFKNVYGPKGCPFCHQTGFSGRRMIFEHVRLNNAMIEALNKHDLIRYEEEATKALKDQSLSDNAWRLAFEGETSCDEALSYMD